MSYPPQGNKADLSALATAAALAVVNSNVNAVRARTDTIGLEMETGGILTTDGNEQNIYINNAPEGVYIPRTLDIDFTNQTVAETLVIKQYKRMYSGGGWIKFDEAPPFVGVQDPLGKTVDLHPTRFGLKVTAKKEGGDNKAYRWEVFFKKAP